MKRRSICRNDLLFSDKMNAIRMGSDIALDDGKLTKLSGSSEKLNNVLEEKI